jgi:hypothetical protein
VVEYFFDENATKAEYQNGGQAGTEFGVKIKEHTPAYQPNEPTNPYMVREKN